MSLQTWDQLLAWFRSRHPTIGETEAMTLLALAYRDLCSEFRWSFLLEETAIQTEAPYSTGTVAVTSGSTVVNLTGGTWSTGWTNRRIVISGRGESYVVSSITGATGLTLALPWAGDDDADATYTMYRSRYGMPSDCDYGMEMTIWDADQNCPLPLVSIADMKEAQAYQQGVVGTPAAAARAQITVDNAGNPISYLEFGPEAPGDVLVYPTFYFKKPAAPTGSGYPQWPQNYEDLIPRRAEIELEQNPRHRVVLHPEAKQKYHARLFDLKRRNDGGAEISRRIQRYAGNAWSAFFRNVNFTSTGINPLTGA